MMLEGNWAMFGPGLGYLLFLLTTILVPHASMPEGQVL